MRVVRLVIFLAALIVVLTISAYVSAVVGGAQIINPDLRPDIQRALRTRQRPTSNASGRKGGYQSSQLTSQRRPRTATAATSARRVARAATSPNIAATTPITPGTSLSRVLHTAQISLTSAAGTDEQFADRNADLVADERTTFDSAGGSFDIAVGRSGARYEVFSGTVQNRLLGVLVVALDTNGDYVANQAQTFDLERDFSLPSAAAVVAGVDSGGREFIVVSSSGFFNEADPTDPNNEPSPGVVLLVRDPITGDFDDSRSRALVTVGDNKLFNANGLALMPNNDVLIADFRSNELRVIRDTNNDGLPDTLDNTPYYSYNFSDDAPLDVAVNSRGVVFSHSVGNETLMLAIYDDNSDGQGDRDEVVVEGLSIDNNLFLHGLTVDRKGNVYVIEDASSTFDDEGNGGVARIDAFPDPNLNGFLENGQVFTSADFDDLALSGLGIGSPSNSTNNTQFFVTQHYNDFLNRSPDAAGLAFWMNNIDTCGSNAQCREVKRIDTSAAFFLSIEFQETGFLVYRLYKTSFAPSGLRPRGLLRYQEFLQDAQEIGRDVVVGAPGWSEKLNTNIANFVAAFVARSEFQAAYPAQITAAQYVDGLNALAGQALSHSERNALVNGLNSGQETRATALRRVAEDTDFKDAEFNRAFVLMQYFGYLRRNPNDAPDVDFGGYDFWLSKLNQFGGDFRAAEMVKAFISSIEYEDRFR
jgi:Domain of unknown function (DUF4214)